MNKLNFSLFSALILIISGCFTTNENSIKLDSVFHNKNILTNKNMIVSCVHCSCIFDFLNTLNDAYLEEKGINIYADTNCIGKKIKLNYKHIAQSTIDSITDNNYNIMLTLKVPNSKTRCELLKTENFTEYKKQVENFFK